MMEVRCGIVHCAVLWLFPLLLPPSAGFFLPKYVFFHATNRISSVRSTVSRNSDLSKQKNTGVVRQTNLLHVKWCIPVWEKDVTRFRKSSKRSNPLWPSWCCGRNELLMLQTTLQNGSIKVDEYKRHYTITTGTFTLQPLLRWLQQVGRVGKEV